MVERDPVRWTLRYLVRWTVTLRYLVRPGLIWEFGDGFGGGSILQSDWCCGSDFGIVLVPVFSLSPLFAFRCRVLWFFLLIRMFAFTLLI